jgi:hypothetical protein
MFPAVQLQPKPLSGGGSRGGGGVRVDVRAEESLAQDGDQAALGLLAASSAFGDEGGVVGGDSCGCSKLVMREES